MHWVSAILWGALELAIAVMFGKKFSLFQNNDEETGEQEVRKRYICVGIFVLVAVVCGWRTIHMVLSVLDCIKVFVIYVVFTLAMLTDMESYTIPNVLALCIVIGRVILFIPEIFLRQAIFGGLLIESLVGGVICLVVLLIISLATKGGFGMGDVKLLTAEGFMIGLYGVINTLMYALLVCAVYALIILALKKKGLKDKIAFAPFIYAGFSITLLMGGF